MAARQETEVAVDRSLNHQAAEVRRRSNFAREPLPSCPREISRGSPCHLREARKFQEQGISYQLCYQWIVLARPQLAAQAPLSILQAIAKAMSPDGAEVQTAMSPDGEEDQGAIRAIRESRNREDLRRGTCLGRERTGAEIVFDPKSHLRCLQVET